MNVHMKNGWATWAMALLALLLFVSCGDDDDDDAGDDKTGDDDDSDDGVPRFVEVNYIDLDSISRISKFRSGIGHSYTDEFESCRSMKHYFAPLNEIEWSEVKIYSPVDGIVVQLDLGWAGTQIRIESTDHPGLFFILFHVNVAGLENGDSVEAGQQLGTHIGTQTWSDIAVGHDSADGWRLLSYFDVMTDSLFETYEARGLAARGDAIIPAADRDAAPLFCDGEEFADEGNLENWIVLD
jgi:hypothetical protein